MRVHAEGCRVDEQVRHREVFRKSAVPPVEHLDIAVSCELLSEARGFRRIAHTERDALDLGAQQAPDNGARGTTGTEQSRFPFGEKPCWASGCIKPMQSEL